MAETKSATQGNRVRVHYTGTFPDGISFDSSEGKEPIEFVIGEGKVIRGFETAATGMHVGEEKDIVVPPKEGYGERNAARVRPFPRQKLPAEPEPRKGMLLKLRAPDGRSFPATIDHVEGESVYLDFNHPLAGKTLHFHLKMVDVVL